MLLLLYALLYALLTFEHMRGFFASLSMRFIGADWVSENNCINNLHSFIIFDLILFNGFRPVISITIWKG
jgi:hypothetical protein